MTNEERLAAGLQMAGREIAQQQMLGAVETAQNEDQMGNQIYVLHWAAIHMLATDVVNMNLQDEMTMDQALDIIFTELRAESEMLMADSENITMMRPGEKAEDHDSEPTLN